MVKWEYELHRVQKSSTIERYDLFFKPNGYAFIVIDMKDYLFTAITDWGNYSYMWGGNQKRDFKEFLSTLNEGYLYTKFCGDPKSFDGDATEKAIKKDILDFRRQDKRGEDAEFLRDCWDEVDGMEHFDKSDHFFFWFQTDDNLGRLYDDPHCIPCKLVYTGWQEVFVEKIFPVFQGILKAELAEIPK